MEITFGKWILLKNISVKYNKKQEFCIKEFAISIGTKSNSPQFAEVFRYLVENNIITLKSTWTPAKIVIVNIEELDKLIEDNKIWSEFAEYIHAKKLLYSGI